MAQVEMRLLGRAAKFLDAHEVLARILEDVERLGVDHVVLSGDLTTLALDEEFATARRALNPLSGDPSRLTIVPGNHDRYTPGSFRERRFERHFADHLQSDLPEYQQAGGFFPLARLVGDRLAVVALDSSLVPVVPGLAYGRVGRRQLSLFRAMLADLRLRDREVMVAVHHGPYDEKGLVECRSRGLWDAADLLSICREGGVGALLHGHVHGRFYRLCTGSGVRIYGGGSSTQQGREGYWLYQLRSTGGLTAEEVDLSIEDAVPRLAATRVA